MDGERRHALVHLVPERVAELRRHRLHRHDRHGPCRVKDPAPELGHGASDEAPVPRCGMGGAGGETKQGTDVAAQQRERGSDADDDALGARRCELISTHPTISIASRTSPPTLATLRAISSRALSTIKGPAVSGATSRNRLSMIARIAHLSYGANTSVAGIAAGKKQQGFGVRGKERRVREVPCESFCQLDLLPPTYSEWDDRKDTGRTVVTEATQHAVRVDVVRDADERKRGARVIAKFKYTRHEGAEAIDFVQHQQGLVVRTYVRT